MIIILFESFNTGWSAECFNHKEALYRKVNRLKITFLSQIFVYYHFECLLANLNLSKKDL